MWQTAFYSSETIVDCDLWSWSTGFLNVTFGLPHITHHTDQHLCFSNVAAGNVLSVKSFEWQKLGLMLWGLKKVLKSRVEEQAAFHLPNIIVIHVLVHVSL